MGDDKDTNPVKPLCLCGVRGCSKAAEHARTLTAPNKPRWRRWFNR